MYKKILLAIDLGDEESLLPLLKEAEALASSHGAELHVLTVVPSYTMPLVGSFFPPDYEKNAMAAAREALIKFLDDNAEVPGAMKGHVAHGTIYDEIMKAADKFGCDLIMLAAHRPALRDYLLGPNAARVVRHANQSVFVVRR